MRRSLTLAWVAFFWAAGALAFSNAPIGSVIQNVSLPTLSGAKRSLLAETNVSVFLFIKPGSEHTHTTLVQIAACERELAGLPIYWSLVVSDRVPKPAVEAELKSAGLAMPVLIDRADALYGKLGVTLHPVLGITDQDHKLLAYQPFAKVNYAAVVRARILHALKRINDEELEQVLKPVAATLGGDASVARRFLKLAEKQFQATNYIQALVQIKRSLDKEQAAAAYSLRGRIYAAQGKRDEALGAFEAALKLDPSHAAALEGISALR